MRDKRPSTLTSTPSSKLLMTLHQSLMPKPNIGWDRDFCLPHVHSTPPLGGGGPVGILPYGLVRKTRMGLQTVKKVWEYVYSFRQNTRTWQTRRQTDGRTDTARRHRPRFRLRERMHSIARQKFIMKTYSERCLCQHGILQSVSMC